MENNNNVPMAPCTRILAMNMIGDLMRKVGVSIITLVFEKIYVLFTFDNALHEDCLE